MSEDERRDVPNDNQGHMPLPWEATEGYKPLEAEMETEQEGLFPPDIDPTIHIGGTPEEREALEEEYRH